MGSKEFSDWKIYFRDIEPNEFNPLHQYLANIACKIVQVNAKDPSNFVLDQFLLKFEVKKDEPKKTLKEKVVAKSKAIWWAALGMGRKKTGRDKVAQAMRRRQFGLPYQTKELGNPEEKE